MFCNSLSLFGGVYNGAPHCGQKMDPFSIGMPQLPHHFGVLFVDCMLLRSAPQYLQNREISFNSLLQLGHFIGGFLFLFKLVSPITIYSPNGLDTFST